MTVAAIAPVPKARAAALCIVLAAAGAAVSAAEAPSAEAVAAMQAHLAEMTAARTALPDALDKHVRAAEAREPGRMLSFTLAEALLRHPVLVELKRFGGRWLPGTARVRQYNKSANPVDGSGLVLQDGKLTGRLKITLISDGWVPPPGTTLEVVYDLDATLRGGKLAGSYATPGNPALRRRQRVHPESLVTYPIVQTDCAGALSGTAAPLPAKVTRPADPTAEELDGKGPPELYAAAVRIGSAAERVYQQARAADLAAAGNLSYAEALELARAPVPIRPAYDAAAAGAAVAAIRDCVRWMRDILRRRAAAGGAAVDVLVGPMGTPDDDFGPYFGHDSPLAGADGKGNVLPAEIPATGPQRWQYVGNWRIAGPFPADRRLDLYCPLLPELVEPFGATYALDAARLPSNCRLDKDAPIRWEACPQTSRDVKPSSWTTAPRLNGLAGALFYAATEVHSDADREVWLGLASCDYGKLWINDRLVWVSAPYHVDMSARPAVFRARFRQGANRVVMRCQNEYNYTWFWLMVCTGGGPRDAAAAAAQREKLRRARAIMKPVFIRRWRGDGTGRYPDADPVTAWDIRKGLNVLWRVEFDNYSNAIPIVVGNRVFTSAEPHTLICLDKMTGQVLWRRDSNILDFMPEPQRSEALADTKRRRNPQDDKETREAIAGLSEGLAVVDRKLEDNPDDPELKAKSAELHKRLADLRSRQRDFFWWARKMGAWMDWPGTHGWTMPTPVSDGRCVWVKVGTGVAACYDLDGNRRWMVRTYMSGGTPNVPAPILAAGKFILEGSGKQWMQRKKIRGGRGHWMIGLDAETGELAWECGPLRAGGYGGPSTPTPVRLTNGAEEMWVVVTGEGHVVRADDGKMLIDNCGAREPFSSPFTLDDTVYFSTGAAIRLIMQDRDHVGCRPAWRGPGVSSTGAGGAAGGAVCHDGKLYTLSGDAFKAVTVFDAADGHRLARIEKASHGEGVSYPTPSAAGKYVVMCDATAAAVIEPALGLCALAVSRTEKMHGGLAFDGDRIYHRSYESLTCIARKGPEGRAYENQVQAETLIAPFPLELKRVPLLEIPPAAAEKAGPAAAPVSRIYSRQLLDQWLVAGPLPLATDADPLAALGGCAKARPAEGTKLGDAAFQLLDPKFISTRGIDLNGPIARRRDCEAVYYTVADNPFSRVLTFRLGCATASAWLAGVPIAEGATVKLPRGRFGLLIRVRAVRGAIPPFVRFVMAPRFDECDDPNAEYDAHIRRIRDNARVLRRVIQAAPGSAHADRAQRLLAQAGL